MYITDINIHNIYKCAIVHNTQMYIKYISTQHMEYFLFKQK